MTRLQAQVLALVAMEKPITMSADDIRDEKVKVMRCLRTIEPKDCVLGQYTAGGKVSASGVLNITKALQGLGHGTAGPASW